MNFPEIYSATGMMELIQKIGFLPLLDSGIEGTERVLPIALHRFRYPRCAVPIPYMVS